jgi:hypothetical protein
MAAAMTHPAICCTARQVERQVFGIEIELV